MLQSAATRRQIKLLTFYGNVCARKKLHVDDEWSEQFTTNFHHFANCRHFILLVILESIFLSQKDWSSSIDIKKCLLCFNRKTLTIELVKVSLNFIKFEWLGNVLLGLSAVVVGTSLCFAFLRPRWKWVRKWNVLAADIVFLRPPLAKWQQLIAGLSSYWFHNFQCSFIQIRELHPSKCRVGRTRRLMQLERREEKCSEFYN